MFVVYFERLELLHLLLYFVFLTLVGLISHQFVILVQSVVVGESVTFGGGGFLGPALRGFGAIDFY